MNITPLALLNEDTGAALKISPISGCFVKPDSQENSVFSVKLWNFLEEVPAGNPIILPNILDLVKNLPIGLTLLDFVDILG